MRNVPLLRKTMEKIEELSTHRTATATEVWNQWHWNYSFLLDGAGEECGTTACYAGWATILHGGNADGSIVFLTQEDIDAHPDDFEEYQPGESIHIADYAKAILGLTAQESSDLFCGDNSKQDLRDKVNQLIEKEEA